MRKCAVSVILPFYNAEKTLVRSLKSVLDQTRAPEQVICIDDASTDGSLDALKSFLKTRSDQENVKIITLPQNSGVYVARNAGLDAATQPYLAFQDADDFWHPRKLEMQFQVLEVDDRISLSCHRVDVWPPEKRIDWPELEFDVSKIKRVNSQMSLWVTRLHTDSIIMKNVPKYRFDETMRRGGDMLMWLEVVLSTDWNVYHDVAMAWKSKAHYGAGGLSGNLWQAEMANQYSIRSLARKGLISPIYAKILSLWCYLKLMRRYVIAGIRKILRFGRPVHNLHEI